MRFIHLLAITLFFALPLTAQDTPVPEEEPMVELQGGGASQEASALDWGRVGLGLVEFLFTILLGIGVVYFSHGVLMSAARLSHSDLKKDRISAGILSASSIIGMTLIAKSLLYPVFSLLHGQAEADTNIFLTLAFLAAYLVIGFAVAFGTLFLSIKIFDWMTKDIKEMKEIRDGNIAVSLVFAAVIIAMSLFIQDGLNSLLTSLLPGLQVRLL